MNPLVISAQFAAFVWFTKRVPHAKEAAALEFAKIYWPKFLPVAHGGLGRLLGKIATKAPKTNSKEKARAFKLANLQALAIALHTQSWPQAR